MNGGWGLGGDGERGDDHEKGELMITFLWNGRSEICIDNA
jgi:hypothetical protein